LGGWAPGRLQVPRDARLGGYEVGQGPTPSPFRHETPPRTGSVVWDLDYAWGDGQWMSGRGARQTLSAPGSTYEVHLGLLAARTPGSPGACPRAARSPPRSPTTRRRWASPTWAPPVMEPPFYGSWGYQSLGYFAPTSRYGTPQDLHAPRGQPAPARDRGSSSTGVPSHFPTDEHGLAYFDGTHLYEHATGRQGHHPDWGQLHLQLRAATRSQLPPVEARWFWLDVFHADRPAGGRGGSMLYLDLLPRAGEWVPNRPRGRENLEAISFLRRAEPRTVYREHPDVQTVPRSRTAVAHGLPPAYVGGLGFGPQVGHGVDARHLAYFAGRPPLPASPPNGAHLRAMYASTENFVLPLSHDEVGPRKGSLVGRMPGDEWQKLANLRLLFAWNVGPARAKKLLFMGGEIGQCGSGATTAASTGTCSEHAPHRGGARLGPGPQRPLPATEPSLHERGLRARRASSGWTATTAGGERSSPSCGADARRRTWSSVACNFTPLPRPGYRVGRPPEGRPAGRELLNSDATELRRRRLGATWAASTPSLYPHHGATGSRCLLHAPAARRRLPEARAGTESRLLRAVFEEHEEPPAGRFLRRPRVSR